MTSISVSANAKILVRRDTAANWASSLVNPVLGDGEMGYEKDTGKMKVGDGVRRWNQLPYFPPVPAIVFDGGGPNDVFLNPPVFDAGGVN
jgi:hypothetical protein